MIPEDVVPIVLEFIVDDPKSVCRLAQTCRYYRDIVMNNSNEDGGSRVSGHWQKMLHHRYPRYPGGGGGEQPTGCHRLEFARRYRKDQHTLRLIREMADDLASCIATLRPDEAWRHPHWKELLAGRMEIYDVLHKNMKNHPNPYFAFLSARVLLSIRTIENLFEWFRLYFDENLSISGDMVEPNDSVEQFALLAMKSQRTLPELLASPSMSVADQLDDIANQCKPLVEQCNSGDTFQQLQVISRVLFQDWGLRGNEEDYYNYQNSLLNYVLDTKKGIPMSLAIVYTCIARRCNIPVSLIGLPGHLVLGVEINNEGETAEGDKQQDHIFLDVFEGGKILSVDDCRYICASYGFRWDPNFLKPLSGKQVFQRILNNLANCHARVSRHETQFRDMLCFDLRLLMFVHRQPHAAESSLAFFSQDMPLTLSCELLEHYGLLSECILLNEDEPV